MFRYGLTERAINDPNIIAAFNGLEVPREQLTAVREVTASIADSYFPDTFQFGHLAQDMSLWHLILKGECSLIYRQYKRENPSLTKEAINGFPDLLTLNGIRIGVRQAMNRNAREAPIQKELLRPILASL